jgi:hypothetical protein
MVAPLKKFRFGAVSVSVWQNDTKDGKSYNTVSVQRAYKNKEAEWKNTGSLRQTDLPLAILGLQKAFEFLADKSQGTASASGPEEPEILLASELA